MTLKAKHELIKSVGHDLRILAEILSARQLSPTGYREIVKSSYSLLQGSTGIDMLFVGLTDFDLKIDNNLRFKPPSIELEDRLLVDITFEQDLDVACTGDVLASISKNVVSFSLKAAKLGARSKREYKSSWHFDQHDYGQTKTNACHPHYHWQFGGWGLKEVSDVIEGVLVTDAPRLFAPPMDPVLAIDFLLSHFNGTEWNYVRMNEPRYNLVVRNSQTRLWKPYFNAIKDHFDIAPVGGTSSHFHLLPNMI